MRAYNIVLDELRYRPIHLHRGWAVVRVVNPQPLREQMDTRSTV